MTPFGSSLAPHIQRIVGHFAVSVCYSHIIIPLISCDSFKFGVIKRTFAPNLRGIHAKDQEYSDNRTR